MAYFGCPSSSGGRRKRLPRERLAGPAAAGAGAGTELADVLDTVMHPFVWQMHYFMDNCGWTNKAAGRVARRARARQPAAAARQPAESLGAHDRAPSPSSRVSRARLPPRFPGPRVPRARVRVSKLVRPPPPARAATGSWPYQCHGAVLRVLSSGPDWGPSAP